jgi:DNA-binding response OmpR family regulator
MAKILVIEDEELIRDVIVEILADRGNDAFGVATAEEGLRRLGDHALDLVVSDIALPGLSGLELLDEARRTRASLPIVLVSGAGTRQTVDEALARGADGLVTKPFSHSELVHAVAAALDGAAGRLGGPVLRNAA